MRILALDVGNSNTKALLLDLNLKPLAAWRFPTSGLKETLGRMPAPKLRGAACVVSWARELLLERGFALLEPANFSLPLHYSDTVGSDRLAGAWFVARWVGRESILVDAGSAVTVDAVGAGGEFLGGLILPGPEAMARAVGLLDFAKDFEFDLRDGGALAHDTPSAVAGGIRLGIRHGVLGVIREQRALLGWRWPKIILTGGNAWLFRDMPWAYEPFLVALGVGAWILSRGAGI